MHSVRFGERRQSPRYAPKRLAKIEPAGGGPSNYCVITDVSEGGVRLHAPGFTVTDEFVLAVTGDGSIRNGTYSVVWRRGSDVGAKFVAPATFDA
jgi:PilZ domain